MGKYRKKPVIIEAEHFIFGNEDRAFNFITCNATPITNIDRSKSIEIQTLEGVMRAELGDWIIKGIKGEFYPCKDEIFRQTYEKVEE
jgi:hypothetical protein